MKPETVAIFSFLVSLIAYEFLGLLVYAASLSASSGGVNGLIAIAILAVLGALLTGLKVYALERN
jgi:hypothetical protein